MKTQIISICSSFIFILMIVGGTSADQVYTGIGLADVMPSRQPQPAMPALAPETSGSLLPETTSDITAKIAGIHVPFIFNTGQFDDPVLFYANTFGGTVFVTQDGTLVYALSHADEELSLAGVAVSEEIVGGTIQAIIGEDPAVTHVNYFTGNDPAQWQQKIPTYKQVALGEVYPGITVTLKAYGNNVEKLFVVQSGARPEEIRLQVQGVKTLQVNPTGELELETSAGSVIFTAPVAYQEIAGQKHYVEVAYQVDDDTYGFTVGAYDPAWPLIIDPLLASTFLGGTDYEDGYSMALDNSGQVYVTGQTYSPDFPSTSGMIYDERADVFIAKLSADLGTLLAATILGGSDTDGGWSLALDSSGQVYVTGGTVSSDFPTTSGVYDTTYDGTQDVFIAKLSADLNTLQASTFLGGSNGDHGAALALDSSGQVVVTGRTNSSDFPTTPGAYDTTYNDGLLDAFVAKLSADLSTLLAATFLGGNNGNDRGWSLALDSSGQVVVTGLTNSSDFPTTPGAYDSTYNGGDGDIFIAKFSANLNTLLASTFLGGSNAECCSDPSLALDSSGQVAVTGETNSSNFPTTVGAYDTTYNGRQDVFITKLSADLGTLQASTFLGGSDGDYGMSLAFNSSGQVMVIGNTFSSDFPTTPNAYDTHYGGIGDIFIATLNADLSILQVSTFLGGSDWDYGFRGAFLSPDSNRQVVIVGSTFSFDFPTTPGAYNTTYENGDAFIVKIDLEPETMPTPLPTTVPTGSQNPVPEPASVILIGLGLLALFILGRKLWKR